VHLIYCQLDSPPPFFCNKDRPKTPMKPAASKVQAKSFTSNMTNQTPGPLFVVGLWRSGTSLLYALLNQHPEIGLMYEDDIPLLWPLFRGKRAKRDWFERWDFWNHGPQRHKISADSVPREVPNLKAAMDFAYQNAGTPIWGAKSPNYYDRMTKLAQIYPNARFIIIWRDLRGVCGSITRAAQQPSWFTRAGMVDRTIMGCRQMKLQCEQLLQAGMPVHQINYEKLVSDPEGTMKGICDFLGITFDPNMCSLKDADRSAVFEHQHHALVNSSEIVSSQNRTEVLSQAVSNKIARYIRLWKADSQGQWPTYPLTIPDGEKPSKLEQVRDRLVYRALTMYDLAIVFVYCYAPIFLLRGYRSLKRQAKPAPARMIRESANSEKSVA